MEENSKELKEKLFNQKELGWKAEKTLEDMCKDSWKYIQEQMKEQTHNK